MQEQGGDKDMNPVWLAHSRLRRRRFDDCIDVCSSVLDRNPYDQAVWYLKTRALTLKQWIDDSELEAEGIADLLLDENSMAAAPRPGTSARPGTTAAGSTRPMTGGRPVTGFLRPGTQNKHVGTAAGARLGTGRMNTAAMRKALQSGRATAGGRPVTSSGRFVRLGTASMASEAGGPFINADKLDLQTYAGRPTLSRALCDFLVYHDRNYKKALELCAAATVANKYEDWWWKARLGKCYYQLGLHRDAEAQFTSSLKDADMAITVQELCKVYLRLNQPNTALQAYGSAIERHPGDVALLLGQARVHDGEGDLDKGVELYKQVLALDSSNVEAIACLAAHHFYSEQPELALRFYRRLLQMGVVNAEIWNNLGLCCFYAAQYDSCLSCFERALALADDSAAPDVWYNIGQAAVGIGDLGLAYQCFKIAVAINPAHAEAHTNLGVLEVKKGNDEAARHFFRQAQKLSADTFEAFYNGALLAFRLGDFQDSYQLATAALEAYPEHADSLELLKQLKAHFTML